MLHFKQKHRSDIDKKFSYSELLQGYKACDIIYNNCPPSEALSTWCKTSSIKFDIIHHAFEQYKAETKTTKPPDVIDKIVTTTFIYNIVEKHSGKKIADNLCDSDGKQIINNPLEYYGKHSNQNNSQIINNYFETRNIKKPNNNLNYQWTTLDWLQDLALQDLALQDLALKENSSSDSWILKHENSNCGNEIYSDNFLTTHSLEKYAPSNTDAPVIVTTGDCTVFLQYWNQ